MNTDIETLAEQELEDDMKQEKRLFLYELIIITVLLLLIFFRECLWQECRMTEPDFWYDPTPEKSPQLTLETPHHQEIESAQPDAELSILATDSSTIEEDEMVFIDFAPLELEPQIEATEAIVEQTRPIQEIQITAIETAMHTLPAKIVSAQYHNASDAVAMIPEQPTDASKTVEPELTAPLAGKSAVKATPTLEPETKATEGIQELLNQALAARQNKDFAQAETLFEQLRAQQPDSIPFLLESAVVYEWQSKFAEAEGFYQQALMLEPDNINALLGQARLQRWQNQLQQSKQSYQHILQLSADNTDAITGLGMVALMDKNTSNAQRYFNQALTLNPSHHEALAGLDMLEKTFVGSINFRFQYREANNQTFTPDQRISSVDIHHQFNAQWEARASVSQSHSEYDTLNNFGIAEVNQLERRYQGSLMYKPSSANYLQIAAQYDQSSQDDFQYLQAVYGQKFNQKLLVEGSARLQFNDSELENTLYTVSVGHPISDSNWRALGQVFYNQTELEGIDDNYAIVAQTTWEPNDIQLVNFGIASSQINGENKLSLSGSYKHYLSNNLGASISGNYSEQTEQPELTLGLHYRY